MDEKQAIIVKMLELQHLFGEQTDGTAQMIVLKIKQAIDKLASKRTQGMNIGPQVRSIGYFIRDEMREHHYQLTAEQQTVLLDMEGQALDIERNFQPGLALSGINLFKSDLKKSLKKTELLMIPHKSFDKCFTTQ